MRAWMNGGLAIVALSTAGCWQPLTWVRSAVEGSEALTHGRIASNYAKRPRHQGVQIIAHRGYSAVAPENTLAAFRAAVAAGADAVEFDVQLTKDGHPVLMHDATVDRTTDGHGRVADHTLAQIRKLNAAAHFKPTYAREPVPTLSEVVTYLSTQPIRAFIELKVPSRKLASETALALIASGMTDRALVISFHGSVLTSLRGFLPSAAIGRLAYPYDPPGRRAFQIRADAALPFFAAVDRDDIRRAHRAGLALFAWTVNDPVVMRRLIQFGVDGLITDNVKVAKAAIHREGNPTRRGPDPFALVPLQGR